MEVDQKVLKIKEEEPISTPVKQEQIENTIPEKK